MNLKTINKKILSVFICSLIIILGFLSTHKGPTIIDGNIHDVMIPKIAAKAFNHGLELHKDIKSGFGYFYFALHGLTEKITEWSPWEYLQNHNSTANLIFLFFFGLIAIFLKGIHLIDPKYDALIFPFLITLVFCSINIGDFNHKAITWYASYNYHAWSLFFLHFFSTLYLIHKNESNKLEKNIFLKYSFISGVLFSFLFFYKFNFAIGIGSIYLFGVLQLLTISNSIKFVFLFLATFASFCIALLFFDYNIFYYLINIKEISSVRSGTLKLKGNIQFILCPLFFYITWSAFKSRYFSNLKFLVNKKICSYIILTLGFILCLAGDYNQPIAIVFIFLLLISIYRHNDISFFLSKEVKPVINNLLKFFVLLSIFSAFLSQLRVVKYKFEPISNLYDKEIISIKNNNGRIPSEDHYIINKGPYGYTDITSKLNTLNNHVVITIPEILSASDNMFHLKDYVRSINETTDFIQKYNTHENISNGQNSFFIIEFTNHSFVLNNDVNWPRGLHHWIHPGTTINIKDKTNLISSYYNSDFIFVPLIGIDKWTNLLGCNFIDFNKKNHLYKLIDAGNTWLIYSKNKTLVSSNTDYLQDLENAFSIFCLKESLKNERK